MKKYKVEFERTETFVIDVLAHNEEEAVKLAKPIFESVEKSGTEHYLESRDPVIDLGAVYDVTYTDDPFNP